MASTLPASPSSSSNNNNSGGSATARPTSGSRPAEHAKDHPTRDAAHAHAAHGGGGISSARAAAQELAAWYLDQAADPVRPHAANVHAGLRGPVTALTASILLSASSNKAKQQPPTATTTTPKHGNRSGDSSPAPEDHPINSIIGNGHSHSHNNNNTTDSVNNSDWQKFLPNNSDNNDNDSTEAIILRDRERLGPRARARLDAFLEGVALAVVSERPAAIENKPAAASISKNKDFPRVGSTGSTESYGLVEGLVGFQNLGLGGRSKNGGRPRSASLTQQQSSSSSTAGGGGAARCPQIARSDLAARLELYLRNLFRGRAQHCGDGAAVLALEPARALRARTRLLVEAFVATVGTVRRVGPVLTRLLANLTRELLAVPVLSENLTRVVRRIVADYVHTTSFASLAFLSSPEAAADRRLTPVILQYLLYLQKHWQHCERECDIERTLERVLDPEMRQTFKTAEFQSIGHLLEVCSWYRQELQNIELGSSSTGSSSSRNETATFACGSSGSGTSARHRQAVEEERLDQAVRDLQREVITVNGSVLPTVTNRTDLIELLANALNTRSVLDPAARRGGGGSGKKKKSRSRRKQAQQRATPAAQAPPVSGTSESESDHYSNHCASGFSSADGYQSGSSAAAAAGEFATPPRTMPATTAATTTAKSTPPAAAPPPRRRSTFRLSTVDFLTKRLLLAAGRTGTGGDAYFVVRDLFGGDDVEVVPSKQYPFTVGARGAATIDLLVRLASVTIRCHASFDVYPKSLVGDCEPLIQIHTTTTETILLQEVRAADQQQQPQQQQQPGAPSLPPGATPVMVLQERPTENSGKRILSVKPALYEKVEVWNTPS